MEIIKEFKKKKKKINLPLLEVKVIAGPQTI